MIGIKPTEPLYGEDAERMLKQASQPISEAKVSHIRKISELVDEMMRKHK